MNRLDVILLGVVALLAVSSLAAPTGGVGIDGRHFLAAGLAASIALRGITTPKGNA